MSSQEEEVLPQVSVQVNKRKKQRACDYCRRKKIRCNGADMPDHRCSRCITHELDCTYEPINTRPPSKSYVQTLESRLQNMEKLFAQMHPNVEIPKNLDAENPQWGLASTSFSAPSPTSLSASASAVSPPPPDTPPSIDSENLDPSEDEREARWNIMQNLKRFPALPSKPNSYRYHGKSSNLMFLQTVMDLKHDFAGVEPPRSADPAAKDPSMGRQTEYSHPQWLKATAAKGRIPYENLPPPDLMDTLVDAYFAHVNVYLPLLHRPKFKRDLRDGLHLRDHAFGAVVLLVCAHGSRFSDDPRVSTDDEKAPGWQWFEQVETARWSLLERPRLEDLQACVLIAGYLGGTNVSQGSWTVIGLGIRMAQDVGAHRKKMYSTKPTREDELWKRAFWVLVTLDRLASFGLGRPCAIHDEDFDVDPLIECDDEYWEHPDPEQAFKQPEGKPSTVAFANCFFHLLKILAFASRTIYSINKVKLTLGFVGPQWEHKIVAELDSALNKWIDTVPKHLKWDPNRDDPVFMNQSATLYANYYLLQICVHRPFIPSPRKVSRLAFPSLTICTNAARSCTHVMDTQFQRNHTPLLLNRLPLFTAGLVLLLNMWGGKRSGLSNHSTMEDVYKCMNMLKKLEAHTHSARRLLYVLNSLISLGELPPFGSSALPSAGKPNVDALIPVTVASDTAHLGVSICRPTVTKEAEKDRGLSAFYRTDPAFAGSGPSQSHVPQTMDITARLNGMNDVNGDVQMGTSFVLPVHTEELGRLPFHYGFSSPDPLGTSQQQHPLQQAFFFSDNLQSQGQEAYPLPQVGSPTHGAGLHSEDYSGSFPIHITGYNELLSVLSAPLSSSLDASAITASQELAHLPSPSQEGGMDVSMMSAENLVFADNMMEMWSTAPTSLEWDEWGAYLNTMTGNHPFNPPSSGF